MSSSTKCTFILGSQLRLSKENIEIVPQEVCVEHKGPETMRKESMPIKLSEVDIHLDPDLRKAILDAKRISLK
ncbi:hypothetical protein WR25_16945 [Diploscapter pachys]|uniref:Uncharacterized protein n=1 Tax=Diploscapter pachys TaxID=2018661 RepID=A0A2A2KR51_9BILA|nr:hypothetical protein WR25_16945 [Diploscapter pachys]